MVTEEDSGCVHLSCSTSDHSKPFQSGLRVRCAKLLPNYNVSQHVELTVGR